MMNYTSSFLSSIIALLNCSLYTQDPSVPYLNCTSTDYNASFTPYCCQPQYLKALRTYVLIYLGIISILGVMFNTCSISTLLYIILGQRRIQKKFGRVNIFLLIRLLTKGNTSQFGTSGLSSPSSSSSLILFSPFNYS